MAATENHRGNGRRQARAAVSLAVPALIVFIAAAYGFGWRWTGFPGQTLFDWFKILVFPAAVALGTVLLNYLVKATEDARDRARARNDDRKAVLAQVIAAYNETKKVRRVLKASIATDAETGEQAIPCAVYEEQLKKLMDPQLRFELYKPSREHRTANAFLRAFSHPDDVAEILGELEAYLNGVIAEYDGGGYQKRKVQSEDGRSCKVRLKDFERLNGFVPKHAFKAGFSSKFRRLVEQMQKEIIDL